MVEDPRPLTGEPPALDLLNTEWVEDGERQDLLRRKGGLRLWLTVAGHGRAPADDGALAAVCEARDAIRAVVERPRDRAARGRLNEVLGRGRLLDRLAPAGPERLLEVDERWRVPWLAAQNLLELLREHPDRIRRCGNPGCVLYFYDASPGGRRQWCSMAVCGNRMKARRHYARLTSARPSPGRGDGGRRG